MRTRRLSFLVCVLAVLVVRLYADPVIALIPDRLVWVRVALSFVTIISTIAVVASYLNVRDDANSLVDASQKNTYTTISRPLAGYMISEMPGGLTITCMRCGMTSYNIGDIANLWCSNCKVYHTDIQVGQRDT